jgi:hypothetical protein
MIGLQCRYVRRGAWASRDGVTSILPINGTNRHKYEENVGNPLRCLMLSGNIPFSINK